MDQIRRQILLHLRRPRCARELGEITASRVKSVQTALGRLEAEGVVRCVTPTARQARLYQLTGLGRVERAHLYPDLRPGEETRYNLPWNLYAWVQAGRYRRLVLRCLHEPCTPRELRERILPLHQRIGMSHVHAVLRDFRAREIAALDTDGLWRLTDLGRLMREAAFGDQSNGH